jgi:Ca2+-binding EF-hand superfamily protein
MLTEFQKQKLPRLFALHDLDGDGALTRDDFEAYARGIASERGWDDRSEDARELRTRFLTFWDGLKETGASTGSARVGVPEWLEYWDRILANPALYDGMITPLARMVFTILDRDGDGAVTAEEYATIYQHGGLDSAEAPEAFARLDGDGDGRLSIDEVVRLFDEFFRSDDPAQPGNVLFGAVPGAKEGR